MNPTLLNKINQVRALGLVVVKTSRNTGINASYASFVDIWELLHPALTDAGLSVGFLPGTTRIESVKDIAAWVQSLTMEVSDGETMIQVPFEIVFPEGNRGTNITQRQGMAHTYGKRYALINYFQLITGDDDDAQRLGVAREESVLKPSENQHWRDFCHVPLFDVGSEETARTWTMLADPSDDSQMNTLGDATDPKLAKTWIRFPDHPGLNAWRAELVGNRASSSGFGSWDEVVASCRSIPSLPSHFAQCTGEQLNLLGLALAKK